MNTVPDLNKATALAATGQTKAAAAPRKAHKNSDLVTGRHKEIRKLEPA